MTREAEIPEAETRRSKASESDDCGEKVPIPESGEPPVQSTPIEGQPIDRRFGALQGRSQVDSRFFEPLPNEELCAWDQAGCGSGQ